MKKAVALMIVAVMMFASFGIAHAEAVPLPGTPVIGIAWRAEHALRGAEGLSDLRSARQGLLACSGADHGKADARDSAGCRPDGGYRRGEAGHHGLLHRHAGAGLRRRGAAAQRRALISQPEQQHPEKRPQSRDPRGARRAEGHRAADRDCGCCRLSGCAAGSSMRKDSRGHIPC